jgi:hypothetical protein
LFGKLIPIKFVAIFAVNLSPIRPLFSPSKWIKSANYYSTHNPNSNYALSRIGESRLSSKVRKQTDFLELGSTQSEERIIESGEGVYADRGTK